jgi:hypothetical protein
VVQRDGSDVVFVLAEGTDVARRVPVVTGLRGDGVIAVRGEGLVGRVVTLGQQRLADGAEVRVAPPGAPPDAPAPTKRGRGARP